MTRTRSARLVARVLGVTTLLPGSALGQSPAPVPSGRVEPDASRVASTRPRSVEPDARADQLVELGIVVIAIAILASRCAARRLVTIAFERVEASSVMAP